MLTIILYILQWVSVTAARLPRWSRVVRNLKRLRPAHSSTQYAMQSLKNYLGKSKWAQNQTKRVIETTADNSTCTGSYFSQTQWGSRFARNFLELQIPTLACQLSRASLGSEQHECARSTENIRQILYAMKYWAQICTYCMSCPSSRILIRNNWPIQSPVVQDSHVTLLQTVSGLQFMSCLVEVGVGYAPIINLKTLWI